MLLMVVVGARGCLKEGKVNEQNNNVCRRMPMEVARKMWVKFAKNKARVTYGKILVVGK